MTEEVDGRKVYCVVTDKAGNKAKSSVATLKLDRPAVIDGNTLCSICEGSGDCTKCGGDMWYWGWEWEWVYVNGSPELENVNKLRLCDSSNCHGGACENCGGDGYE